MVNYELFIFEINDSNIYIEQFAMENDKKIAFFFVFKYQKFSKKLYDDINLKLTNPLFSF